eukprot:2789454-Pleurochrysis_carterae.AAC.2
MAYFLLREMPCSSTSVRAALLTKQENINATNQTTEGPNWQGPNLNLNKRAGDGKKRKLYWTAP